MMKERPVTAHATAAPKMDDLAFRWDDVITFVGTTMPEKDNEAWLTSDCTAVRLPPGWTRKSRRRLIADAATRRGARPTRWTTLAWAKTGACVGHSEPDLPTKQTAEAFAAGRDPGPDTPWTAFAHTTWTGRYMLTVAAAPEGEPCEWDVEHLSDPAAVLRGTAPTADLAMLIARTVARSQYAPRPRPEPVPEYDPDEIG